MTRQGPTEQELIDAFIRSGRMKRLPCAAVGETTAEISAEDRVALATYHAERDAALELAAPRRRVGPSGPPRPALEPTPASPPKVNTMDEFSSFRGRPRLTLVSSTPLPPPFNPPPFARPETAGRAPAAAAVPGPAGVGIDEITWMPERSALRFLMTDGTTKLVVIGTPIVPQRPASAPKPKPVRGSWSRQ